jgi:O-succinylbenzoic acid--CoA ligase
LPFEHPAAELEKTLGVARVEKVLLTGGIANEASDAAREFLGDSLIELPSEGVEGPEEIRERFLPWDEDRAVLMTSGSTGAPRPIPLTTGQIAMSAFGSAIRLGHHLNDRWLCCLPLHHVGGFSILQRAAFSATTVALHPRFVAARVANTIDNGSVSLVSLVPTMLERVLEVRGDTPFPETLRAILVGGAGVSEDLVDRCRQIRAPVSLTWGMTEAASQIATRFPGELDREGGAGTPLPFCRVEEDDEGVLVVRGPTVRGTLRTNDRGHLDENGHVTVVGRHDDTIISGGENISPVEVESVLRSHPAVKDAVVVAFPHVRWGERHLALLVETPASPRPSDDELDSWCHQTLANFKVPDRYIWVDEIPLGPLGKRPRKKARELAKELEPELFAEKPDSPQAAQQFLWHGALLESLEINCHVHEPRLHVQSASLARNGIRKNDGAVSNVGDVDIHSQPIAHANGIGVVSFGVNHRRSPVVPRERTSMVAKDRGEEFLIRLVTILEGSTEECDAGRVSLKESSSRVMHESHGFSPLKRWRVAA